MKDFLLFSIVGSVILTVAVNFLPLLFPNAAAKAQRKLEDHARRSVEQHEDAGRPRVKVFFPWKFMVIGSLVLTVLVNLVGYAAR